MDTGSRYAILDLDFWEKVKLGQDIDIVSASMRIVGAGGKSWSVVGEGRI